MNKSDCCAIGRLAEPYADLRIDLPWSGNYALPKFVFRLACNNGLPICRLERCGYTAGYTNMLVGPNAASKAGSRPPTPCSRGIQTASNAPRWRCDLPLQQRWFADSQRA